MAVVSGIDGSVTFASGYTTNVKGWSINIEAEDVDITALGENWSSHQAGLRSWSGTYNALIDEGSFSGGSASDIGFAVAAASAEFKYGSSGSFVGNIVITGCDAEAGVANHERAAKTNTPVAFILVILFSCPFRLPGVGRTSIPWERIPHRTRFFCA